MKEREEEGGGGGEEGQVNKSVCYLRKTHKNRNGEWKEEEGKKEQEGKKGKQGTKENGPCRREAHWEPGPWVH